MKLVWKSGVNLPIGKPLAAKAAAWVALLKFVWLLDARQLGYLKRHYLHFINFFQNRMINGRLTLVLHELPKQWRPAKEKLMILWRRLSNVPRFAGLWLIVAGSAGSWKIAYYWSVEWLSQHCLALPWRSDWTWYSIIPDWFCSVLMSWLSVKQSEQLR